GLAMKFFKFESFISSRLIKVVFYLGLLFAGVGYVGVVGVSLFEDGVATAVGSAIGGGILLVIGVLLWRVYCELAIVVFRIYEELNELRQELADASAGGRGRQRPERGEGGRSPDHR
ncbi:MAG: DUF4282 domain-containing protein, partial [Bradymonadaceae bacterium]